MEEKGGQIPFGMLFEEPATQPEGAVMPVYDEERDLSFVRDPQGFLVPCVEFAAATGTQTNVTKVWNETADTDPEDDRTGLFRLGTMTITEVERESTDTDPEDDRTSFFSLSTITGTRIRSESTDTDPEEDN
jgi:hypothetical protein